LAKRFGSSSADSIATAHAAWMERHGKHAQWQTVIDALPEAAPGWRMDANRLMAGEAVADLDALAEQLRSLIPWRKGPLTLGGVAIETEWRSDWKWARIARHVDLRGEHVLDVGAGNGYFGWAMLAAGAASVIGCDPTQLFVHQHQAISHFAGPALNLLLASTLEDLDPALTGFDTVCSLGVLYHRRDHQDHLHRLAERLGPAGRLVLETLILPGDEDAQLDGPPRYANMRNVHALPTQARLLKWVEDAGYEDGRCVDITATTVEEQRRTDWMPFHSLREALDPSDFTRTIEGLPAPLRAVVIARRGPAGF
jgi:tRNA (mo5U34)-methyltransferase